LTFARWIVALLILSAPPAAAAVPVSGTAALSTCNDRSLTRPIARTSHAATFEDYPLLSRVLGEQGNTIVSYVIQPDGTVNEVKVQSSSGSLRLDDASVGFVSRYLFTPATRAGAPVACRYATQMTWQLSVSNEGPEIGGLSATLQPTPSDYPPGALERHETGRVIATIFSDESGTIASAFVVRQSAYADLNDATLTYLKKRKLKPLELDGRPVKSVMAVEVDWSPDGKPLPKSEVVLPTPDGEGQEGRKPGN